MPPQPSGDFEAKPRWLATLHCRIPAILLVCVVVSIYNVQWQNCSIVGQSLAAEPALPPAPEAPAKLPKHFHARLLVYLDKALREQPVKTAADWQLRRQQILSGMQQAMGPLPDRSKLPAPTVRKLDEQNELRFKRQSILVRIDEHDQVPAYLYLPKNRPDGQRLPAIIALHQTIRHGKKEVDGQGTPDQAYARELANRGYVVLAPDYPSFGDYQCDFTDKRFVSGTIRGIYNHMRCVDLLVSMPEVDPQRIGAIGHSLGGHNAMFLAAFDQRIAATVSSCGWTPFHDYYYGKLDGWTPIRYMPRIRTEYGMSADRLPFDFYEVVAAFAPRAFLSVSPLHDVNFDVAGVKKGILAAKAVYRLLGAEDALQVRCPDCGHAFPDAERQAAYTFLDRHLNHKSAPDRTAVADELKKLTALEPPEALKSFSTIPGLQIELLAAEPLLRSPVAMDYDADGRLYVVEMCDYSEQRDERLGSVRRLEDTNGDGRFDRAVVVADRLSWPTAVLAYDGGVFVGAAPDLLYLKDHNGDGRADEKRVVFTGFGRQNVQGLLNSFRWGLDNRIYVATSSNGGLVSRPDAPQIPPVSIQGRNLSFDPRTLDIRLESSSAQHGLSQDDWGRWFLCSNSDHLSMVMYEDRYAASHETLLPPARNSITADGPQAEIFRTSPVEPWRIVRTRLRMQGLARGPIEKGGLASGYFSGATGVTAYRGDALPAEMRQQVFVADPCSNLVHRKSLTPDGVGLVGRRIDERREFVSSSDTWFRPVQMANAPDGSLQILDMYREVIEHPHSLPPEIKPHIDLTNGRDCGRLYRMVPTGFKQPTRSPARLSGATVEQLVATLEHRNGWHRDTASRLIFERQDMAAVSLLEKLSNDSKLPEGRMQAMYALAGLNRLTEATLRERLQDDHPRVRDHAVRLAEHFKDSPETLAHLLKMSADTDARVRYQLGFTLGIFPASPSKQQALVRLAQTCGDDPYAQASILSAVQGDGAQVMQQLLAD
ncbi:MAG: PVC-type heme-binding CxxCH protein, partial [Planctomycetota bacterium]|nr:PVC-type heme-binding CxxCH protein [Planctomycetota bacterium]